MCNIYVSIAGEKIESTFNIGVGELEVTPVSKAIGRYLGLDLSPEACAARNRKGIAFIVYGTPSSGIDSASGTGTVNRKRGI